MDAATRLRFKEAQVDILASIREQAPDDAATFWLIDAIMLSTEHIVDQLDRIAETLEEHTNNH